MKPSLDYDAIQTALSELLNEKFSSVDSANVEVSVKAESKTLQLLMDEVIRQVR